MSKRRHIFGEKTGLFREGISLSFYFYNNFQKNKQKIQQFENKISARWVKNIDAHFSRLNFFIPNRYFQNVFLLLSMFIKVGKTSSSDCV